MKLHTIFNQVIKTGLLILLLTGCRKFLDVRPSTGTVNPSTISDFEEMLNNDSNAVCNFILADIMTDDVQMSDAMLAADQSSYYAHAYLWAAGIWNPGDLDPMYNNAYTRILQMNIILEKIDGTGGEARRKNIIRAQAQINRAWYYLQLANLYGPDYRSATMSTDLAVPLVLAPNANELPSRATVQQVYDQVLSDLKAAVVSSDLPDKGQTIVHPGKSAGYALLAKVYLYMGNYMQAEVYADSTLQLNHMISDYNNGNVHPASLADLSKNPEVLLARLSPDYSFYSKYHTGFFISASLGNVLDSNDTRLTGNFSGNGSFNPNASFNGQIFNYSVTVPEVLLIKAECLARKNDTAGALELVNQLRQKRLVNYVPLDPGADAMMAVLQERRRELFYHGGARLFDLKRLNRDDRLAQTLQRVADDGTTVLAALPPNSPRYLMPFSPVIIANNPKIVQNPR